MTSMTAIEQRVTLLNLHRTALRIGKMYYEDQPDHATAALDAVAAVLGPDGGNLIGLAAHGYACMRAEQQARTEEKLRAADFSHMTEP
jgi:hypothetical protein